MSTLAPALPRHSEPHDSGYDDVTNVVVFDDDAVTFEHVIKTLMRYLAISEQRASAKAADIHNHGEATVWFGHRERAELIHVQLNNAGLTAKLL